MKSILNALVLVGFLANSVFLGGHAVAAESHGSEHNSIADEVVVDKSEAPKLSREMCVVLKERLKNQKTALADEEAAYNEVEKALANAEKKKNGSLWLSVPVTALGVVMAGGGSVLTLTGLSEGDRFGFGKLVTILGVAIAVGGAGTAYAGYKIFEVKAKDVLKFQGNLDEAKRKVAEKKNSVNSTLDQLNDC